MVEYVVMDYDGEPVSIEDGEILWWDVEDGERWNAETLSFEPDDEDDDSTDYDDDDWDWSPNMWNRPPRRESNFDEQARYFYRDLL